LSVRLVLDTNVIVSALLHSDRTPARAVRTVLARRFTVLFDDRIEREYRTVLARPKFRAIDPTQSESLLAALLQNGERVESPRAFDGPMIDPDDRVFVEVALAGRADALVTGNARHYACDFVFAVLSPAQWLERIVLA
jgi:putative PIN family toxin of toxin-antitoxin system